MTNIQLHAQSWQARGTLGRTLATPNLATSWLGFREQDEADAVPFELRVPSATFRGNSAS